MLILSAILSRLKHLVLDLAHPLPVEVELYSGHETSLHGMVLTEAFHSLDFPNTSITYYDIDCDVVVRVDDDVEVQGIVPVLRYLGRLNRTYPTAPLSALLCDAALDILSDFLHDPESRTPSSLQSLEGMLHDDAYLSGLDSMSIADVAWRGVMKWILRRDPVALTSEMYPNLYRWWTQFFLDGSVEFDAGQLPLIEEAEMSDADEDCGAEDEKTKSDWGAEDEKTKSDWGAEDEKTKSD